MLMVGIGVVCTLESVTCSEHEALMGEVYRSLNIKVLSLMDAFPLAIYQEVKQGSDRRFFGVSDAR